MDFWINAKMSVALNYNAVEFVSNRSSVKIEAVVVDDGTVAGYNDIADRSHDAAAGEAKGAVALTKAFIVRAEADADRSTKETDASTSAFIAIAEILASTSLQVRTYSNSLYYYSTLNISNNPSVTATSTPGTTVPVAAPASVDIVQMSKHVFEPDFDISSSSNPSITPASCTFIFVKSLDGKTFSIPFDMSDIIFTIKKQLVCKTHIPVDEQILTFGGKPLGDCNTLYDYNIQKDSTLELTIRLRAGAMCMECNTDPCSCKSVYFALDMLCQETLDSLENGGSDQSISYNSSHNLAVICDADDNNVLESSNNPSSGGFFGDSSDGTICSSFSLSQYSIEANQNLSSSSSSATYKKPSSSSMDSTNFTIDADSSNGCYENSLKKQRVSDNFSGETIGVAQSPLFNLYSMSYVDLWAYINNLLNGIGVCDCLETANKNAYTLIRELLQKVPRTDILSDSEIKAMSATYITNISIRSNGHLEYNFSDRYTKFYILFRTAVDYFYYMGYTPLNSKVDFVGPVYGHLKRLVAIVGFIGLIQSYNECFVGLVLINSVGYHDGEYAGRRYFYGSDESCIFARVSTIRPSTIVGTCIGFDPKTSRCIFGDDCKNPHPFFRQTNNGINFSISNCTSLSIGNNSSNSSNNYSNSNSSGCDDVILNVGCSGFTGSSNNSNSHNSIESDHEELNTHLLTSSSQPLFSTTSLTFMHNDSLINHISAENFVDWDTDNDVEVETLFNSITSIIMHDDMTTIGDKLNDLNNNIDAFVDKAFPSHLNTSDASLGDDNVEGSNTYIVDRETYELMITENPKSALGLDHNQFTLITEANEHATANMDTDTVLPSTHIQQQQSNSMSSDGQASELLSSEVTASLTTNAYNTLKEVFKFQDFKPGQLDIILHALQGQDTFGILPTSGGKTLIYAITALNLRGICIVFSPLKALIKNQISFLESHGIRAISVCSANKPEVNDKNLALLSALLSENCDMPSSSNSSSSTLKFLFITPEGFKNKSSELALVIRRLYRIDWLSMFVVDEAHCVSDWGHDFRPDYLGLSHLRLAYSTIPIMCLTATANSDSVNDIVSILRLKNVHIERKPYNRDNLILDAREKSCYGYVDSVLSIIGDGGHTNHAGIVYVHSRESAVQMTTSIQTKFPFLKDKVAYFHAGMKDEARDDIQDLWENGELLIIVATIAFGMGINHLHVQFVIVADMPSSLSCLVQMWGRAGRCGISNAYCYVLYSVDNYRMLYRIITEGKAIDLNMYRRVAELQEIASFLFDKTFCLSSKIKLFLNGPTSLSLSSDGSCNCSHIANKSSFSFLSCSLCSDACKCNTCSNTVTLDVSLLAVSITKFLESIHGSSTYSSNNSSNSGDVSSGASGGGSGESLIYDSLTKYDLISVISGTGADVGLKSYRDKWRRLYTIDSVYSRSIVENVIDLLLAKKFIELKLERRAENPLGDVNQLLSFKSCMATATHGNVLIRSCKAPIVTTSTASCASGGSFGENYINKIDCINTNRCTDVLVNDAFRKKAKSCNSKNDLISTLIESGFSVHFLQSDRACLTDRLQDSDQTIEYLLKQYCPALETRWSDQEDNDKRSPICVSRLEQEIKMANNSYKEKVGEEVIASLIAVLVVDRGLLTHDEISQTKAIPDSNKDLVVNCQGIGREPTEYSGLCSAFTSANNSWSSILFRLVFCDLASTNIMMSNVNALRSTDLADPYGHPKAGEVTAAELIHNIFQRNCGSLLSKHFCYCYYSLVRVLIASIEQESEFYFLPCSDEKSVLLFLDNSRVGDVSKRRIHLFASPSSHICMCRMVSSGIFVNLWVAKSVAETLCRGAGTDPKELFKCVHTLAPGTPSSYLKSSTSFSKKSTWERLYYMNASMRSKSLGLQLFIKRICDIMDKCIGDITNDDIQFWIYLCETNSRSANRCIVANCLCPNNNEQCLCRDDHEHKKLISTTLQNPLLVRDSGSTQFRKAKLYNFICDDCSKGFVLAVQLLVHKRKFLEGCMKHPLLDSISSESKSNSSDASMHGNTNGFVQEAKPCYNKCGRTTAPNLHGGYFVHCLSCQARVQRENDAKKDANICTDCRHTKCQMKPNGAFFARCQSCLEKQRHNAKISYYAKEKRKKEQ